MLIENYETWLHNEIDLARKECKKDGDDRFYMDSLLLAEKLAVECKDSVGNDLSVTLKILDRLVKGRPLTEISEDGPWDYLSEGFWSHSRYDHLYRKQKEDGSYEYIDTERFTLLNCLDKETTPFYGNFETYVMNHLIPIQFPYFNHGKLVVYLEEFDSVAASTVRSEWDTFKIVGYRDPLVNHMIKIDKCFHKGYGEEWDMIDNDEYVRLKLQWSKLTIEG